MWYQLPSVYSAPALPPLAIWYQLGRSLCDGFARFFDEQPPARAASFRISRAASLKATQLHSPSTLTATPSPLLPSPPLAVAAALVFLLLLISLTQQLLVRAAAAAKSNQRPAAKANQPRVRTKARALGERARPSSAPSAEAFSRAQYAAGLPRPGADGACPELLLKLAAERTNFFEQRLSDETGWALARMEGATVRVCSRSRVDTSALEFRTEASFSGVRARTVLEQWECGSRSEWDQSVNSAAYLKRFEPRPPKRETGRITWHERNDFLRRIGPEREAPRHGTSEPPYAVEVQVYLSQPAAAGLSAPLRPARPSLSPTRTADGSPGMPVSCAAAPPLVSALIIARACTQSRLEGSWTCGRCWSALRPPATQTASTWWSHRARRRQTTRAPRWGWRSSASGAL